MIKVAISGVLGKMGQVLRKEVLNDHNLEYIGGFDRSVEPYVVDNLDDLKDADVLIDFSTPKLLNQLLEFGKTNHVRLILATTGYTEKDFELINTYSKHIPIFYSQNYS